MATEFCTAHTHTRLTALFPGLPGRAGTRKVKPIWILLKQETVSGRGISWAICKSAPCSREITTPAPHHSVFLQAGCPSCRPTNSVRALKASSVLQSTIIARPHDSIGSSVPVTRQSITRSISVRSTQTKYRLNRRRGACSDGFGANRGDNSPGVKWSGDAGEGGRRPPLPPLFWTEMRAKKLVHCCNGLLTETQCKIISVQQINIDLLQTLKRE